MVRVDVEGPKLAEGSCGVVSVSANTCEPDDGAVQFGDVVRWVLDPVDRVFAAGDLFPPRCSVVHVETVECRLIDDAFVCHLPGADVRFGDPGGVARACYSNRWRGHARTLTRTSCTNLCKSGPVVGAVSTAAGAAVAPIGERCCVEGEVTRNGVGVPHKASVERFVVGSHDLLEHRVVAWEAVRSGRSPIISQPLVGHLGDCIGGMSGIGEDRC